MVWFARQHSRDLCWRLRACRRFGADVLHGHRPADDNNRVRPVVGDTPLLILRRQK
jgi:hypothetical protein